MPVVVQADPGNCTPNENENMEKQLAKTFSCAQTTGITYRFTECANEILKNVAKKGFDSILKQTGKIVSAVLMIFVSLHGVKMVLGGVRNIKGETITMLLKLAFVAAFALKVGTGTGDSGLQQAYTVVHSIDTGLVDLVGKQLASDKNCSVGNDGNAEQKLWKRVDCSILAFIGKNAPDYEDVTDENGNTMKVAKVKREDVDLNCDGTIQANEKNVPVDDIALFGIGLAQLFTPAGIFVFFLLVVAAIMMLIAFGRALQVYTISFVAITFLMLLGPFFIPLFLFARTRQMFMTWVSMIIGYMIQPAMLMAFLVFLLASMNVALYGDPTSASPGLVDSLTTINNAMEINKCTRKVLGCMGNAIKGIDTNTAPSANFQECTKRLSEEINAITAPVTPIHYPELAVFMVHLIACIVLLYVMMALMNNVADFVASLSAGAGSNLARFGGGMQQLLGAAKDAASSATK